MKINADFYKDKRILVTGHTGFKGSWLCRILLNCGAQVTGYALEPPTDPSLFGMLGMGSDTAAMSALGRTAGTAGAAVPGTMRSVIGDIRDLTHLKQVFDETKPEIVIHLAAQPLVRTSYEEPVYTYETNVMGTVNVCECVRTCPGVRSFLNVTTDKVYKNNEWEWGYREDDYLDGYDPYSNSKSCSELVTHSYINSFFNDMGIAVSTARAGNVIGGGDFARDRIIPDCVRAAEKNEPVIIRNPFSVRPFQHVLEPLTAYLLIIEKQWEDRRYAGFYNVGPDDADCITTGELTDIFCEAWGCGMTWINKYDGGPHEAGFLKLDCSRIKQKLGWKPDIDIRRAVEMTVEWSKQYVSGASVTECTDRQIRETCF